MFYNPLPLPWREGIKGRGTPPPYPSPVKGEGIIRVIGLLLGIVITLDVGKAGQKQKVG
jgi:hypothetical protein